MRAPRRTNFPGAAKKARRYRDMGIDTSIVASRPVLAVRKEIGEPGLRDKVVAVLTDGAGKCYNFFGQFIPQKLWEIYTFRIIRSAIAAVGLTGMTCVVSGCVKINGLPLQSAKAAHG